MMVPFLSKPKYKCHDKVEEVAVTFLAVTPNNIMCTPSDFVLKIPRVEQENSTDSIKLEFDTPSLAMRVLFFLNN